MSWQVTTFLQSLSKTMAVEPEDPTLITQNPASGHHPKPDQGDHSYSGNQGSLKIPHRVTSAQKRM